MVTNKQIERVLVTLPALPATFADREMSHLMSIMAALINDRLVDELVFNLAVRLSYHRAQWDQLVDDIGDVDLAETATAKGDHFLSGKQQTLAFHENRIAALERELMGTPYARQRAKDHAQTDFLDRLDCGPGAPDPDQGGSKTSTVIPYQPLKRSSRA